MRIDDASSVSVADERANGTLVQSAIIPGQLSVVQIDPEDTIDAVLEVLAQHGRPAIIVLSEQGGAFCEVEDFARLKQMNIPSIFVLPRERMSSLAKFAYNEGFAFTSSFAKAEALFLQQHSQPYCDPFVSSYEQTQEAMKDIMLHPSPPSLRNHEQEAGQTKRTSDNTGEHEPSSWANNGYDPVAAPFSEVPLQSAPRKSRPRKRRQILALVVAVSLLVIISAALLPTLFAPSSSLALTVQPHQSAHPQASVGLLSFTSSGQLDPNSSTGLNDIISLNLEHVAQPPTGMSLYAWLLSDNTQDSVPPILLGKLQIVNGKVQLSRRDPQHTDLLGNYSRFLVTEQASNITPSSPPIDEKAWKYQGSIPDIPTPGDEQSYSLLSHIRHLLAKDPTLIDLGLSGGLDIWLYRNTGKVFEWSNAARDDWGGKNTDLLLRLVDRVVQYLDGQVYAWRDLPTNTPWLVDPKVGRPGLIDFTTAQNEQGPASYVSHVRLHLIGIVNAPGHTEQQKQLASKIDTALTQVETALMQVRKDAVQLAKMSAQQLKSQDALALLNDMQINASSAYIGNGVDQSGVVWIHNTLQQLAQMNITTLTQNQQ